MRRCAFSSYLQRGSCTYRGFHQQLDGLRCRDCSCHPTIPTGKAGAAPNIGSLRRIRAFVLVKGLPKYMSCEEYELGYLPNVSS